MTGRRKFKGAAKKIVGLFPELLGVGGIQEAGRLTAAALEKISLRENDRSAYFQSLSDPPGAHEFVAAESKMSLRGFGRSKMRFALSASPSLQTGRACGPRSTPASGFARGRDEMVFATAQDDCDVTRSGGVEAVALAATPGPIVGGYCACSEFRHGAKASRNPRCAAVKNT